MLLHAVALSSLLWSFKNLFAPSAVTTFMETQFAGHWGFLTVLGLAVSTITVAVSLLKDAFPSVQAFDTIKTALQIMIVPAEGMVSVLYWGMSAYDPTLLVPPDADFQIPLALDLGLHALPALFLWIDFLAFSPRMSKDANPLLICACTSKFLHLLLRGRHIVDPELSQMQRSAFYLAVLPVLLGLYHTANGIHDLVRGRSTAAPEAEAVKKIE
ncbi:hypothetical protein RQP46_011303 [Phenoliferia psychrophenolica]